jgi:Coenzyme PQQ synthesis protein D (PqqD)
MDRSFKLKSSTVHERFGDETVILNLDSGSYYSAQGISSVIWGLVSDGCSESNILQRVRAEFTGDADEIASATTKFLDQLVEEALVDGSAADGDACGASASLATPSKAFSIPLLQKYTDMEEMLLLDPIHEVDEQGWPSARRPAD